MALPFPSLSFSDNLVPSSPPTHHARLRKFQHPLDITALGLQLAKPPFLKSKLTWYWTEITMSTNTLSCTGAVMRTNVRRDVMLNAQ